MRPEAPGGRPKPDGLRLAEERCRVIRGESSGGQTGCLAPRSVAPRDFAPPRTYAGARSLKHAKTLAQHSAPTAARRPPDGPGTSRRGIAPTPYLVQPDPADERLTQAVTGIDQTGARVEIRVVVERPLTLYLNAREIVTMMTIGDHPDLLALGYLLNQNMLRSDDVVTDVEFDPDLDVVVVRTEATTDFEEKLRKRTLTSGCAQGTAFGDLMEALEGTVLPEAELRTSWLYALTHRINTTPSLYLEAGAIHGCVLCERDRPLVYMEDVGRHNAVDKIAGYMFRHRADPADKIFYTTGRLTSEMVIKTVRMGIPILVSRSGFTAWGVELARKAGLTLIGRARGQRFLALSGEHRIVFDADLGAVAEESARHRRKGETDD